MKRFCFFLFFLFLIFSATSQTVSIRGIISDSSEHISIQNGLVTIFRQSDSLLLGFTRSDKNGNFKLDKIPRGNTIVMVTYPSYAEYVDVLPMQSDSVIDMGRVYLTLKSQLLQEVVVTNNAPIRIKGDTIEYKADSFHLSAGSTVEDLLKKLPGIQVDKNGKITAQGEAVHKVLIDGEEFFSDDPTVVTQSMLSDAVNKVQVYNKKK